MSAVCLVSLKMAIIAPQCFQYIHQCCCCFRTLWNVKLRLRSCSLHGTQTKGCLLSLHLDDEQLEQWQDVNHSPSHDNLINNSASTAKHFLLRLSQAVTNRAEASIKLLENLTREKVDLNQLTFVWYIF